MSEPTTIKAIVTKYWMSQGPKLVEAEHLKGNDKFIKVADVAWGHCATRVPELFNNKDWQPTKRDATDDVLNRYLKRRVAIRKAMETLDAKRDRALKMIEGMDIS